MPKMTYSLRKRYFIQIIKIVICSLTIQWYWYLLNIVLFWFINVLLGNSRGISVARGISNHCFVLDIIIRKQRLTVICSCDTSIQMLDRIVYHINGLSICIIMDVWRQDILAIAWLVNVISPALTQDFFVVSLFPYCNNKTITRLCDISQQKANM